MVFKSLFSSSNNGPSTSGNSESDSSDTTANFLKFLTPFLVPSEGGAASSGVVTGASATATLLDFLNPNQKVQPLNEPSEPEDPNQISPLKLLKLLQPLLNESLVKDINLVYEFHIKSTSKNEQNQYQVYYLDLKNVPTGSLGVGSSPFASKADCIIKTTDKDLSELIQDKLKPFTAYMSGRIEIEGDLQDVFKLKRLIKSVTSVIAPLKKSENK
jgi:putative sterol carrier protein